RRVGKANGARALSSAVSSSVMVNEVNSAPVLPAQSDRTINELTTLTVTNTATDGDLPANVSSYQLVSPPTGASISASGVISWTPSRKKGARGKRVENGVAGSVE